jgi:DNA mismatch repair protein MutL
MQMQSLAMAHPDVAMTLVRDGRIVWQAAATQDPEVRIRDLFGGDFVSRLMPVSPVEEHGIRIEGFLAKPGEGRPDRELQFVILNRRVVQCPAVFQSLREAYSEALPKGRHPLAVLRIEMDPLAFDCNVHPAKREVRLHRPDQVRQAVYTAARRSLEAYRMPVAPVRSEDARPLHTEEVEVPKYRPVRDSFAPAPQLELPVPPQAHSADEEDSFRLIGGLGRRWVLMEGAEGLVLMDSRAASERILFETFRREAALGHVSSQHLLLPEVVELTAKDAVWISENLHALNAVGFST